MSEETVLVHIPAQIFWAASQGPFTCNVFSPFFLPFKNGLNVVLWRCLHMMPHVIPTLLT